MNAHIQQETIRHKHVNLVETMWKRHVDMCAWWDLLPTLTTRGQHYIIILLPHDNFELIPSYLHDS